MWTCPHIFTCFGCLVCFLSTLQHYWEHQLTASEKKCHFVFDSGKNVNFKLIGEDFFMISISKIMVPLLFPHFLLYMDKFARVLVTYMKNLLKDSDLNYGCPLSIWGVKTWTIMLSTVHSDVCLNFGVNLRMKRLPS